MADTPRYCGTGDWNHRQGGVYLDTPVSGAPVIEGLFELADAARAGKPPDADAIQQVFDDHVGTVNSSAFAAH